MPDIQYLGHSCFRLRGRDGIILTDPFDRTVGIDIGKPTAHIVTISHAHPDHSNIAAVRPAREQLFVVDGPGEYEVGGVLITGVRTFHDKKRGAELGRNTVFVIHLDDVAFCHLGDLGHELTAHQIEEIGNIDVLFLPVGGGETIGPGDASSIISQIEPRLVIPMHFAADGQQSFTHDLAPLDRFIHEMGIKEYTPQEKLTVTSSSLPTTGDETRVIVMQPVL
ncbi:MAG TPA: MBL fold metallo-hydrolase [Roseiflexaceae bacterium]|nr:MBL fold metallo-hydrolase [Roseiflexaceae bacterium]HMP39044.1 MBL fold metallo-hydrolase [Roseiflexaceae bacterium]